MNIVTKGRAATLLAGLVLTAGISFAAAPANAASTESPAASVSIDASSATPGTTVVIDSATGQIVDSYKTENVPVAQAVSPVGPGCTTVSLCLRGPGAPYGYTGAGTLNVNVADRSSYYNGNWTTRLQWNAGGGTVTGATTGPGVTTVLTSNVTVTQVRLS